MRRALLAVGLMLGCGPDVEDGIFEASMGQPGLTTAGLSGGTGGGSESSESTDPGPQADTSSSEESGAQGSSEESGSEAEGCPEAVGPGVYDCPVGFTFFTEGASAQCRVEDLALPPTATVFEYCAFLDDGYFGFGWQLGPETVEYTCPPGTNYAPNATVGYCLWQDLVLPPTGASAACQALATEGWLGFQWSCPASE